MVKSLWQKAIKTEMFAVNIMKTELREREREVNNAA